MENRGMQRRSFLNWTAGCLTSVALPRALWAQDEPEVKSPRATSGDRAVEPRWDEALTITVGPETAQIPGQISGAGDRAIQAAVDYVARLGGGTVKILPGTFRLDNAIHLRSRVRLSGSGLDTILIKNPSVASPLAADSDWFDQEITIEKSAGFEVGHGVCLQTTDPHDGGEDVLKRTLVARSGNRFKLDRPLGQNFWVGQKSTVSTLFPILSGEEVTDVAIENLALDGNRAQNALLNGNYAGCIFLQDSSRVLIRGVTARNYNGDGVSWQVSHDVVVEDCHSHGHAELGLHPGSGSQRPVIRRNRIEGTRIGLFFCWGVRYGLAEENRIADVSAAGISIGHRDTDNLIRANEVLRSGVVGVLFRKERGKPFAPHRNRVEANRIVDSGPDDGAAIDVQGETESIVLARNELRETRAPARRIGVKIGAETRDVKLEENRIEGFQTPVSDLRRE